MERETSADQMDIHDDGSWMEDCFLRFIYFCLCCQLARYAKGELVGFLTAHHVHISPCGQTLKRNYYYPLRTITLTSFHQC